MTFQFTCPQGHLLEGDESFAGQPCTCPHCQMLFIIPAPVAVPQAAAPPVHAPVASLAPPAEPALPRVGPSFSPSALPTASPAEAARPVPDVTAPVEPELLHIPCPNGHELDTPREMLNQEVLCPHCGAQFLLREQDSVEFKRKKQAATEAKDRKLGQTWLNWAIAIAVLVLIGLVVLILATSG
jgi:hypothetical protein